MKKVNNNEKYQNLWEEFLKGNDDALSLIYYDFFDLLFSFGIKYTSDKSIVEDCIQNLFVSLLSNRHNQKSVQNIKFYLIKGLKNQLIYSKRQNKKFLFIKNNENFDFRINHSVERILIDNEKSELQSEFINKVIKSLTNRQKEALYLKYICEFDYSEIADLMSVNIESVRTLIYRTLKSLNETYGSNKNANILFRE